MDVPLDCLDDVRLCKFCPYDIEELRLMIEIRVQILTGELICTTIRMATTRIQ